MMQTLDITLEVILFIITTSALFFLVRSRKALTLKAVKRARIFLFVVFFLILAEDVLGIYFGFGRHPDTITLESLALGLVGTALYYSGKARHERPKEYLGMAAICIVWAVVGAFLELVLGLILKG